MLVDDIFDTGNTINALVNILLDYGVARENIKVVVHDYKEFIYKPRLPVVPDYWARKITISNPEEDCWIHYMSHEMVGLKKGEFVENYCKQDAELETIIKPYLGEE